MLDLSPVTVSGPITAARARAIWTDGRLAVFAPGTDPQTFTVAEPERVPIRRGRPRWSTALDTGEVLELQQVCSCGGGNPLGRVPRASLLASLPAS